MDGTENNSNNDMDYGVIFIILIIIVILMGLAMYFYDSKKHGADENVNARTGNARNVDQENEENIIDVQNEQDLEQIENN